MKACTHHEALIGRSAALNIAVANERTARPYALPHALIVYQEQPKRANGAGILPHKFKGNDGRDVPINGGKWEAADRHEAAQNMGDWFAANYAAHTGPIILNIESIPLSTPEARTFWEPVSESLKLACPRATFGFYDRPDMSDLMHFSAPAIGPNKRINAECWGLGEHEYTPAAYRQAKLRDLTAYDRKRPIYAVCNVVHEGGAWASCFELREQWRLAQDLGLPIVWWGSLDTKDNGLGRARACLSWIASQARATPVLA